MKETSQEMLVYKEPFRPQYHFTPATKWMNDPNGLVYHQGVYHLFYQYYPDDIVWGPMHWGHATSKDLLHWEHKPIALFPDEHGLIFSGSAVVDMNNTSGLGTIETPPLVAIFTYHDLAKEEAGGSDYQTQGIAYSLDNGDTWTKYDGNPVIPNTTIKDFRDPKVFWDNKTAQWVMALVAGDHLQLFSSDNLISWTFMSEFGRDQGAHGGVWECPDLFELPVAGTNETKWVLLISINPGAPNGGSGTQYFVGDFDGTTFTSDQEEEKWIDWGTDNYAGVTYNNTPNGERIFIGWMSNWEYARDTPTKVWRSAMTLPRTLSLAKIEGDYHLLNFPIDGVDSLLEKQTSTVMNFSKEKIGTGMKLSNGAQSEIRFETTSRNFSLNFSNDAGEQLTLTMQGNPKQLVLDRSESGLVDFQENFANIQRMPMTNLPEGELEVRIFLDASSLEIFVNKGQYVMTAQVFPKEPYKTFKLGDTSPDFHMNNGIIHEVKGVW
jgi:fructan beta-fructosidase